jgi:hypothetical protein
MELGELLRSLFFVFDVDLFTDIYRLLLQIVFTTQARLREGVLESALISSAHDLPTCGTVFNHPFSTRPFGGALFSGSHSTASAFFCHLQFPL